MWIAGLDALRKPLLHLHTQANVELPWADIDFDFMNLNQAAHGDREFGYIQTRLGVARKTVVGPRLATRGRCARSRTGSARPPAGRRRALAEARPLRRQHALRRRHRGRQDRGRAALRRRRSTPGASTSSSPRSTRPASADVDALVAEYVDLYDVAPELLPGRRPPPVAARRRGHRARPAVLPRGGRLRRVHHDLRGPRRAQAAARPRRPAADGRGLRLRRRGRLEDRHPGAGRERHGRRAARAAPA